MQISEQLADLATTTAQAKGLPPEIVKALIVKESTSRVWAWRPEPPYRYLWDVKHGRPFRALSHQEMFSPTPPKDFPAPCNVSRVAEWWGQKSSWGYMQVMGAVGRECGYSGDFLGGLYEPAINIEIGCRHLKNLARRYLATAGWPGVVAAYNAGSPRVLVTGQYENQQYVDDVQGILDGSWPRAEVSHG